MTVTRIIADHMLTMDRSADDGIGRCSPGVVDIADGRIRWAGPAADAPPAGGDSTTHSVNGILMPGLVNTHAHTPMTLLRGLGDGLPTGEWLRQVIWPREAKLTVDDIRAGMMLGASELLANGVTTTIEMYFAPDDIGDVAAELGLRCIIAPPLLDGAGVGLLGSIDDQFAAVERSLARWDGHPTVTVAIGPHAAYTLGDDSIRRVVDLSERHDLLVTIHLAEQRDEPAAVARLDHLGLLGPRTLAAHGVWLDAADIEVLAARGVSVAHCPVSNGRHASGMAPVVDLLQAGVGVGLGTDGPVSDPRLDLFDAMREAQHVARLRSLEADHLTAVDVLHMATAGAADAIGRPDLGRIEPGARADLIEIDLRVPIPDRDDLPAQIVGSVSGAEVRTVWVEGRQVVHEGACVGIDPDIVRADAFSRAVRLL